MVDFPTPMMPSMKMKRVSSVEGLGFMVYSLRSLEWFLQALVRGLAGGPGGHPQGAAPTGLMSMPAALELTAHGSQLEARGSWLTAEGQAASVG